MALQLRTTTLVAFLLAALLVLPVIRVDAQVSLPAPEDPCLDATGILEACAEPQVAFQDNTLCAGESTASAEVGAGSPSASATTPSRCDELPPTETLVPCQGVSAFDPHVREGVGNLPPTTGANPIAAPALPATLGAVATPLPPEAYATGAFVNPDELRPHLTLQDFRVDNSKTQAFSAIRAVVANVGMGAAGQITLDVTTSRVGAQTNEVQSTSIPCLRGGESREVTFPWTSTEAGPYLISGALSAASGNPVVDQVLPFEHVAPRRMGFPDHSYILVDNGVLTTIDPSYGLVQLSPGGLQLALPPAQAVYVYEPWLRTHLGSFGAAAPFTITTVLPGQVDGAQPQGGVAGRYVVLSNPSAWQTGAPALVPVAFGETGLFTTGHEAAVELTARAMVVKLHSVPSVHSQEYIDDTGALRSETISTGRLGVEFTSPDQSGQELLYSRSWLAAYGITNAAFEYEDGTRIPYTSTATHYRVFAPHFTVIYATSTIRDDDNGYETQYKLDYTDDQAVKRLIISSSTWTYASAARLYVASKAADCTSGNTHELLVNGVVYSTFNPCGGAWSTTSYSWAYWTLSLGGLASGTNSFEIREIYASNGWTFQNMWFPVDQTNDFGRTDAMSNWGNINGELIWFLEVDTARTTSPPTPCFTVSPTSGTTSTTFNVNAACSTDSYDSSSTLQVRWDWTSDGTYDTSYTTTKTASTSYSSTGTKCIRLQVKDSDGDTATTSACVTVSGSAPNTSPNACFTVSPSSGTTSTTFSVNAGCSTDAETSTSALQVKWDWTSDGAYDTGYTTAKTASTSYTSSGTKCITVRVLDGGGLEDTESACVSVAAASSSCATPGPDSGGYTCSVIPYTFTDISGSGTTVTLADDEVKGPYALGFSFNYYGTTYTSAYISSNGFISFVSGGGSGCCAGQFMPDSGTPNTIIAGYWEDLYPPGGGSVKYQTVGTSPSQRFIVQWTAVPHHPSGSPTTFQIVLKQSGHAAETFMQSVTSDGGNHVTGVENSAGAAGLRYKYGSYSEYGAGVRFTPPASPPPPPPPSGCFTVTPSTGTTTTNFKFDAACTTPTTGVNFRWDWESDGTYDTAYSTSKIAYKTFSAAGTKCVRLEASSSSGTSTYTTCFTVTMAPPTSCMDPGPDAGGYTCAPMAYAFTDIAASGTALSLADDQLSGAVPMGFSFAYRGASHTHAYISSNGFLTFDASAGSGCCSGQNLPQGAAPNNVIAGFWEDLNPPGGGSIRYQTVGSAPNRQFIAQWTSVPHYPSGNPVTFQVVLKETSNQAEVRLKTAPTDGGIHVTGTENAAGSVGLRYQYGSAYAPNNWAVRFTPPANAPPNACFTFTTSGRTVNVNGGCSSDPDPGQTITAYDWDWTSDGTYDASGMMASHTYPVCPSGTFTVRLRVTDSASPSASSTTTRTVSVADTTDADGDGLVACRETMQSTTDADPDNDDDALSDFTESVWWPSRNAVFCGINCAFPNPRHKDIYVEMDYMLPQVDHYPTAAGVTDIRNVFAAAPVANPDGINGINLWLDADYTGTRYGGANSVAHDTNLGTAGVCYDWTSEFDALKIANFAPMRDDVWHYMIWAHELEGCGPGSWSGIARTGSPWTMEGHDFLVTLGGFGSHGTAAERQGTFIHELGHNLNLRHGGGDDVNFKPNYLSVMNYYFQLGGRPRTGTIPNDFSYSQWDLPDLDENSLTEGVGLNTPLVNTYRTSWHCPVMPPATTPTSTTGTTAANTWQDWNCSTVNEPVPLALDLNADGWQSVLESHNDWANIQYDGDGSIGPGLSVRTTLSPQPAITTAEELTYELAKELGLTT